MNVLCVCIVCVCTCLCACECAHMHTEGGKEWPPEHHVGCLWVVRPQVVQNAGQPKPCL